MHSGPPKNVCILWRERGEGRLSARELSNSSAIPTRESIVAETSPHPSPLPATREREPRAGAVTPIVSLIAAVARNGAIGANSRLPWRLSSDLKRFKALTMGKPVIMGRKTFDSIGKPLPGRRIIVVTRDALWARDGVEAAQSIEAALALCVGADETFIAGGGEIYAQTVARADRLYITEVDLAPEANVRFPHVDPELWRERAREAGLRGERDDAGFAFVQYERQR